MTQGLGQAVLSAPAPLFDGKTKEPPRSGRPFACHAPAARSLTS